MVLFEDVIRDGPQNAVILSVLISAAVQCPPPSHHAINGQLGRRFSGGFVFRTAPGSFAAFSPSAALELPPGPTPFTTSSHHYQRPFLPPMIGELLPPGKNSLWRLLIGTPEVAE
jgi:hypothetical protein